MRIRQNFTLDYSISVSSTGGVFAFAADGNCASIGASSGYFTPGKWTQVAYTYDKSSEKLYVNGVLEASANCSQALQSQNGDTVDMSPAPGGNSGTFDDVRIYNRALSITEVQQLYHMGQANAAHSNMVPGTLTK